MVNQQTLLDQFNVIPLSVKRLFRTKIINWFTYNGRDFPWRRTTDPYKIFIAEILLQKTDVRKVSQVFGEFVKRYPNIATLAEAENDEIKNLISNIGLSYRAQRLTSTAKYVTTNLGGHIPCFENELMMLPGVGKYISRAVLSAAFGERKSIVDTNVIRIMERFFGLRSQRPRPRTDPELWEVAEKLQPRRGSDCRNWNYALIDFCSLVCTHYNPKCTECTLVEKCKHQASLFSQPESDPHTR